MGPIRLETQNLARKFIGCIEAIRIAITAIQENKRECWVVSRRLFTLAVTPTVCCSLIRHQAEIGGDIKNRASGSLQLPPLSRFLRSPGLECAGARGLLPPPPLKRAANGRVTDSGFKKSYEDNKYQKRSVSTGECPAIVGFKNSRLRRSYGKSGIAYADRFGLPQSPTAHPIRTDGNRWPLDLALFSGPYPPRLRRCPLASWLSLEPTPLSLAAPLRFCDLFNIHS